MSSAAVTLTVFVLALFLFVTDISREKAEKHPTWGGGLTSR